MWRKGRSEQICNRLVTRFKDSSHEYKIPVLVKSCFSSSRCRQRKNLLVTTLMFCVFWRHNGDEINQALHLIMVETVAKDRVSKNVPSNLLPMTYQVRSLLFQVLNSWIMSSSSSNFSTLQSGLLSRSSMDGLPCYLQVCQKLLFKNRLRTKKQRMRG